MKNRPKLLIKYNKKIKELQFGIEIIPLIIDFDTYSTYIEFFATTQMFIINQNYQEKNIDF